MHPPGYLFALLHPITYGLQYILLDALTGVCCCLPDLLAYLLTWPYHNIVTAFLVLSDRRLLCRCMGGFPIKNTIAATREKYFEKLQFPY